MAAREPPTLRNPRGGYLAAATAASASAALFVIGNTIPQAPRSRTRLTFSPVFQGMRTSGTLPAWAIAWNISAAVSSVVGLCSISTVSQSKPTRAMNCAAKGSGSTSQVPMAGLPSRNNCFTVLVRIIRSRSESAGNGTRYSVTTAQDY
jgi:hypothetical protein